MISPALFSKIAKVVEAVSVHGPGAVAAFERTTEAYEALSKRDPAAFLDALQRAERQVNAELAKADARAAAADK